MSHSITFAFSLDFTASSVSVPFLAQERHPRTVEEGATHGANRPNVRYPERNVLRKECVTSDPPLSVLSPPPTSVTSSPLTPRETSTAPGARPSRATLRRPQNAFILFRTHYLKGLRAREAAEQARRDPQQVLSSSSPTTSDIAPTLINDVTHNSASDRRLALHQAANAWRAMSPAEREAFFEEARAAKARFVRELPAFVWNKTRSAEGTRRGPVAARREHPAAYEFFKWEECQAGSERGNI
ncbi:uncharacterized protein SCHCODRAFT_02702596 [Schizophyllum commune H4-8]|nr:uncharacterized protein SCHCODRAFT_02702596 [Schizophyllum commune H4-8]KAI5889929.1 hypothetical protein SCHCODRAFT_02702596 [Schizophyllum commune H4-8]